jgi:hypothetical protein
MRNVLTAPAHSRRHTAAFAAGQSNRGYHFEHQYSATAVAPRESFIAAFIVSFIPLLGFTSTAARACACESSPVEGLLREMSS